MHFNTVEKRSVQNLTKESAAAAISTVPDRILQTLTYACEVLEKERLLPSARSSECESELNIGHEHARPQKVTSRSALVSVQLTKRRRGVPLRCMRRLFGQLNE